MAVYWDARLCLWVYPPKRRKLSA